METREQIEAIIKRDFEQRLHDLKSSIDSADSLADIDEESVRDREDFSHQNEATDLKSAFKSRLVPVKAGLEYLDRYDGFNSHISEEGSILVTENLIIYLGLSFENIERNNQQDIIGISTKAPIYNSLVGLKAGNTFKLGEQSVTIQSIL